MLCLSSEIKDNKSQGFNLDMSAKGKWLKINKCLSYFTKERCVAVRVEKKMMHSETCTQILIQCWLEGVRDGKLFISVSLSKSACQGAEKHFLSCQFILTNTSKI